MAVATETALGSAHITFRLFFFFFFVNPQSFHLDFLESLELDFHSSTPVSLRLFSSPNFNVCISLCGQNLEAFQ